ncbi:hypothetical protein BP00DRAFT_426089 [Aspergillus indologenus CBS 114.80]|uniref:Uncharacterized protein n=1 Tax=Aspergillus indologenus CBS 114.80 TaxID=1450541 RepID=A0A2V5I9H2_9EURO|nr:hypothetical protein BP00DRAFT_426089 [Aspergillus indologenus CBS 114.80]
MSPAPVATAPAGQTLEKKPVKFSNLLRTYSSPQSSLRANIPDSDGFCLQSVQV